MLTGDSEPVMRMRVFQIMSADVTIRPERVTTVSSCKHHAFGIQPDSQYNTKAGKFEVQRSIMSA